MAQTDDMNKMLVSGQIAAPQQPPAGYTTAVPMAVNKNIPPLFKMENRWDYLKEYIYEFWMVGKKAQILAVVYAILGFLVINAVPWGALLLFALAGRYQSIAWWGNAVAAHPAFGGGRALIMLQ